LLGCTGLGLILDAPIDTCMSEMTSFGRMFAAGVGGVFVSCLAAAGMGLLILASALSGFSDVCSSSGGGCGGGGTSLVVSLVVLAMVGIALSAGTIRVLLGRRGRGMTTLLLIAGGLLFAGTTTLLTASIVVGHVITGGAGALWLPLGLLAAICYLYLWSHAMTGAVNRRVGLR
jgi:hypothetical protein